MVSVVIFWGVVCVFLSILAGIYADDLEELFFMLCMCFAWPIVTMFVIISSPVWITMCIVEKIRKQKWR